MALLEDVSEYRGTIMVDKELRAYKYILKNNNIRILDFCFNA